MPSVKFSIVAIALLATVAHAQAAGIKGRPQQGAADSQRAQAVKGPLVARPPPQQQQQQQYLAPPPPPPAPFQQAIIVGPGQAAPVFAPARVQPIAPPPAQPIVQQQQQEPIVQQQQQEPESSQQQQQQEEIDPNAAAQDNAPAIAAPARPAAAAAAASEEEANPRPEPYAFQYAFDAGDAVSSGSSQREEQQDANGRVTGFYTLRGEDGRDRRVDYVADASGFRATISTNELGTAPKDTADVDWNAQNPTEAQLRAAESATQAARQRALLNPQQPAGQASGSSSSPSKVAAPRSKTSPAANGQQQQQQQQQEIVQQLQEPFEQIRQTELKGRARKSRHAPFYLFTV